KRPCPGAEGSREKPARALGRPLRNNGSRRVSGLAISLLCQWSYTGCGRRFFYYLLKLDLHMNTQIRLAINGYGRIGRCFLRALYESPSKDRFRIVAINEPADLDTMAYLTRFDSTHGVFHGKVEQGENCLRVDGHDIAVTHAGTPEEVDWQGLGIDLLIECSGQYGTREQLQRFISAGVPRLLLS